jgi:hypothetical protein
VWVITSLYSGENDAGTVVADNHIIILQQNMNFMKTEPDSDSEMYLKFSNNADELLDVKEENPIPITFPVMEIKTEVSCTYCHRCFCCLALGVTFSQFSYIATQWAVLVAVLLLRGWVALSYCHLL